MAVKMNNSGTELAKTSLKCLQFSSKQGVAKFGYPHIRLTPNPEVTIFCTFVYEAI